MALEAGVVLLQYSRELYGREAIGRLFLLPMDWHCPSRLHKRKIVIFYRYYLLSLYIIPCIPFAIDPTGKRLRASTLNCSPAHQHYRYLKPIYMKLKSSNKPLNDGDPPHRIEGSELLLQVECPVEVRLFLFLPMG